MAFEFKLSTDETREKMFNFIKPAYEDIWGFNIRFINWIYGVYDSESGFFITYVNSENYDAKYILITGNGDIFNIVVNTRRYTFSEIPEELVQYGDIIQDGIKFYNNDNKKKCFRGSFSKEQEQCHNEIVAHMKDRCKPSVDINSYEDAEKIFIQENYNYYYISKMYNNHTVANFDKYMSEEKMRVIRGEKYRDMLSKIAAYGNSLSEEEYNDISRDFLDAGYMYVKGTDDIYVEMTYEVIRKGYLCGVISGGYEGFIEKYIESCIKMFPDKIHSLRPILDFINEYMGGEDYKGLELYRKELDKLIYNKVEGFQIILTTKEIREKMFDFLKPEDRRRYGWGRVNINWTSGAYDMESGIFLTDVYRATDGIARGGRNEYGYIVITDDGDVFKADNYEYENRTHSLNIPKQYENLAEKIKEGIDFHDFDYEYRKILSEDTLRKLKAIDRMMDDRCMKDYPINCEEDARTLLEIVDYNINIIPYKYNKKTTDDFNKYATDDKLMLWRGDRYLQLLQEAISADVTDKERCQMFNKACYLLSSGVNDTYDKQFLETVEYMYSEGVIGAGEERALKSYIDTYAEEYPNKLKNMVVLIEYVKTHAKGIYLREAIENVERLLTKG